MRPHVIHRIVVTKCKQASHCQANNDYTKDVLGHLSNTDNAISITAGEEYHLYPDSKVHGAHTGPIWGRQDPGGTHVDPMDFAMLV